MLVVLLHPQQPLASFSVGAMLGGVKHSKDRDGSRDRLGRWFLEYPTWRGRSVGHPFVVSACVADLSGRAKDLFIAANVAEIHRTEIDRTATDARAALRGPRVGAAWKHTLRA